MSETTVLEQPKTVRPRDEKGRLMPKPQPCPLSADLVQLHMDSVSKETFLPTVQPGQTPMAAGPDGRPTPRLSCELDANDNVVPFSGPQFTEGAAKDLWEMLKPHIEHFAGFTRRRMSECLLVPEAKGEIDNRAKVIHIPKGRFVFVPEGKQPM